MSKESPETFVFYPTFQKAIEAVKRDDVQLALYRAVANYGLYGTPPDFSAIDPIGTLNALFVPIQFAIDESKARRTINRENGSKGGAPKGNRNAAKKTTENNQKQPKTSENNLNVNVNKNINENVDVKEREKSVKRFSAPTLEQVKEFWQEKGLQGDAEAFFYHYAANGWVQGNKKPLKSWTMAAQGWSRREETEGGARSTQPQPTDATKKMRHYAEVTAQTSDEYKTPF